METTVKPVLVIRETTRNLVRLNRQLHKDEISDERRSIETAGVTSETIAHIAGKLKNKSAISLSELHIIKNGIIDDAANIEIILNTHGSLRGLVREIFGTDVKRQCVAAGVCCNLALGDSKTCVIIVKAAGPYLVAALDNLSEELAVTCAWTIGNMAGSGMKACEMLTAQGAVAKLAVLLHSPTEAICEASVYALTHFAYKMEDKFSSEHLNIIIAAYAKLNLTLSTAQLLFALSCHHELHTNVPEVMLRRILEPITVSTKTHLAKCKGMSVCCELVYLLRTLANLSVKEKYSDIIVNEFVSKGLTDDLKRILVTQDGAVRDSLLWLLGNVYNSIGDNSLFYDLAC